MFPCFQKSCKHAMGDSLTPFMQITSVLHFVVSTYQQTKIDCHLVESLLTGTASLHCLETENTLLHNHSVQIRAECHHGLYSDVINCLMPFIATGSTSRARLLLSWDVSLVEKNFLACSLSFLNLDLWRNIGL